MDNSQSAAADNDADLQEPTGPNPEGFFPDLADSDACSVAVAVRVRPLVGRELTEGNRRLCIVQGDQSSRQKIVVGTKSFSFDRVFWPDDKQEHVFDTCTRNLVLGCFHGFNATILAYGQTGSGKTHSMGTGSTLGMPFEQVGIVPRVFNFVFEEVNARKAQAEYAEFKVKVAFLELYNEEFHDLLDPAGINKATGKSAKEITIREEKNGVISVRGLRDVDVSSAEECTRLLNSGTQQRQTSATLMNEGSSRSHAIFTITIEQKIVKEVEGDDDKAKGEGDEKATVTEEISSKFHFVDLAGSERIKKTGATGQLLKEGISINKGLLCLGQVISALTEDKKDKSFIPYRDSKLTRILQDSLGGNSRTTMIACVSPAESNYDESLSTIRYASRAKNIKNKPIVNRDPNSMLIESLRQQIQTLQFEVKEYATLLKEKGVDMPNDLAEKVLERQKTQAQKRAAAPPAASGGGGSANPAEVKDLKIKLSHKDKEIRELQQKLKDQQVFLDKKDKQLKEVEKERDNLLLSNESLNAKADSMAETLKKNNVEFDNKQFEAKQAASTGGAEAAQKQGLIDAYKQKLSKAQRDLDAKIRELQEKDQKYQNLKDQMDRNDRILKKHMDENQQLKRQIASGGGPSRAAAHTQSPLTKPGEAAPAKRDFKTMRAQRKENAQKQIADFNAKFLSDLESQIDEMFVNAANRKTDKPDGIDGLDAGEADEIDLALAGSGPLPAALKESSGQKQGEGEDDTQEKQKILEGVRKMAVTMQSDIKDLLKNEWAGSIQTLEGEKRKAENDRKENLKVAKNDEKAILAIEKEHRAKMDSLNNQVAKLEREKAKKEESVAKQIAQQETRIRGLEAEIEKWKKKKDEAEQARKYDENRFFKFKQAASKDLQSEKKKIAEKDKALQKTKGELKKVDQLAQQAIAALKGMQKRSQEEKQRREAIEAKENNAKGIDIDLIKEWISHNTEAMLKHQDLKEYRDKQVAQKDKVEAEMLEEGDRLTEALIEKEKLEFEKEELEARPEGERDEGRLLEIDDNLNDLNLAISGITETLDMLQEAVEFVQSNLNQVTEELESFDADSISPLSFNALESIDSARATLKTFFQVVLDLNIYKRDLETKCLEQDENLINMTANLRSMEARIKFMSDNGGQDGYAAHIAKQNAIQTVIKQVEGFVDQRDVAHLDLNPTEQTNLTKLSLSKIVNNLKKNLKESEAKNQSLSLKLDQALKQKEIYKSRCDELKSQQKNAFAPKNTKYENVGGRLNSHQQQNSTSPFQVGAKTNDGADSPARSGRSGMSFQDRQRLKREQERQRAGGQAAANSKQHESLADRRKKRQNHLIDPEGVSQLGNDLEKLKQNAESMHRAGKPNEGSAGAGELDEIPEEDMQFEEADGKKMNGDLTTIKEEDGEEPAYQAGVSTSMQMPGRKGNDDDLVFKPEDSKNSINGLHTSPSIEPEGNFQHSQLMSQTQHESMALHGEWLQEHFLTMPLEDSGSKLVDFFFLNTKIMCIFEDFKVCEINIATKEVIKSYNLQEIEGFEISEELEESNVVAATLEKDVQLLGVAMEDAVHIFEYSEDEEQSLIHVKRIQTADVKFMIFVEYFLIMVQDKEGTEELIIACSDLDEDHIKASLSVKKPEPNSTFKIQPGTGVTPCLYYTMATTLGKVEVPTMTEMFKVQTGHTADISDLCIAQDYNQVVTTSAQDGSIRFFYSLNGQSCALPMEEMECDSIAAHGVHMITRLGSGLERNILIWEIKETGGVEEMPDDEIMQTDADCILHNTAHKFMLKSGVTSVEYRSNEYHFMMFHLKDEVIFKVCQQKMMKF